MVLVQEQGKKPVVVIPCWVSHRNMTGVDWDASGQKQRAWGEQSEERGREGVTRIALCQGWWW